VFVCVAVARSIGVTDPPQAKKLGNVSVGLSVTAILINIVGFVIAIVVVRLTTEYLDF